jgi:hypothetical protein
MNWMQPFGSYVESHLPVASGMGYSCETFCRGVEVLLCNYKLNAPKKISIVVSIA